MAVHLLDFSRMSWVLHGFFPLLLIFPVLRWCLLEKELVCLMGLFELLHFEFLLIASELLIKAHERHTAALSSEPISYPLRCCALLNTNQHLSGSDSTVYLPLLWGGSWVCNCGPCHRTDRSALNPPLPCSLFCSFLTLLGIFPVRCMYIWCHLNPDPTAACSADQNQCKELS